MIWPVEVECPVCKAKPYVACRSTTDGTVMHLKHDLRRRKGYAVARSIVKKWKLA